MDEIPSKAGEQLDKESKITEIDPLVENSRDPAPQFHARLAGAIALITATSGFAVFVRGKLIAFNDAAVTAQNILASESLYRWAFVGDVVALLYIAYILLLYNIFKPVNRNYSLLAAFFGLVGSAMASILCLLEVAPLVILKEAPSPGAFTVQRSQVLALTFLPRILGLLLGLSGVCYLFNSFACFLSPPFAATLMPYILIPGASELLLALRLVVFGINVQRWHEMAGT